MSLTTKIVNMIAKHPKMLTLGIGLAITFVVGVAIGSVENNPASAYWPSDPFGGCKIYNC